MSYSRTSTRSRIARASAALLTTDVSRSETDEAVIDLLANLRHYCDQCRFDFAKLDRLAYRHYVVELNDGERKSSVLTRKRFRNASAIRSAAR
jgi:hypothetical protein